MGEKKDGGPAFGGSYDDVYIHAYKDKTQEPFKFRVEHRGMSLRDWFAGMALSYLSVIQLKSLEDKVGIPQHEIAEMVYNIADAMLKERQREAD